MKKMATTISAIIVAIAIIVAGASLFAVKDLTQKVERLQSAADNTYGMQYIDSEILKLENATTYEEFDYPIGNEDTYWFPCPVRQAYVELEKNELTLVAHKDYYIVDSQNLEISPDNENTDVDRSYQLLDPSKEAMAIIYGPETGYAILRIAIK